MPHHREHLAHLDFLRDLRSLNLLKLCRRGRILSIRLSLDVRTLLLTLIDLLQLALSLLQLLL